MLYTICNAVHPHNSTKAHRLSVKIQDGFAYTCLAAGVILAIGMMVAHR